MQIFPWTLALCNITSTFTVPPEIAFCVSLYSIHSLQCGRLLAVPVSAYLLLELLRNYKLIQFKEHLVGIFSVVGPRPRFRCLIALSLGTLPLSSVLSMFFAFVL